MKAWMSAPEVAAAAKGHNLSLNRTIRGLLVDGRIALTIPKILNGRLQRYRLVPPSETTARGGAKLDGSTGP
jgi:hypothetical protein